MIISYRHPPDSGGGTNKTSWATSGALCETSEYSPFLEPSLFGVGLKKRKEKFFLNPPRMGG
jgi:hypothetical protein